jgi:hypothetical protein
LAHVARADFLVQTIARLACALHWFNPLVWLAERCLRAECEHASDDLALGAGLAPSDYAAHLVDVLLSATGRPKPPLMAVAMGRRNGLEERLRAILEGERPRSRLSRRKAGLVAFVATCYCLPLGILRLEARAHDAPKLERLPKGMTIEVIGVSTHPSGTATWWAPDGTPLAKAPCDPAAESVQVPGRMVREIVARITGLPEKASLTWHPTECVSRGTAAQKEGADVPDLERSIAEFAAGMATCTVHFDIALGDWTTNWTEAAGAGNAIQKEDLSLFFGRPREIPQGTAITIAHNIKNRAVRVVAIDREGKEHFATSNASGGAGVFMGVDVEFPLPPAQIREYRVQSRPVGRYEIKNVALQPRKAGP